MTLPAALDRLQGPPCSPTTSGRVIRRLVPPTSGQIRGVRADVQPREYDWSL